MIMNTKLLIPIILLIIFSSCNDEWTDEQFENYISFKAPITNSEGVTDIYIRYKAEEKTTYQLPLIVSGSKTNTQNKTVHVALDPDTLETLNYERFQTRARGNVAT